ncbi:ribosomal protein S6 [Halobacteroides halobius DSM 5150]|uniref:Small ribosomal subunit protein bS6 n=1 Tax=Halobacteroides halobius (strain ATCC 35273 / DSM 5150 / MD-1) TaxID=748449 RepID=L0KB04_HALHC|nr:30S ribosomal protein S6 [Halobacteroides halobius]AGB42482.1 ribosomal protein S6 [Halobacteroides halobius DSM 5150]
MRKYETMFILNSDLEEEATESLVEKLTGVIADNDGELVDVDEWGTKELAYEINDQKAGYYTVVNFEGTPATVNELKRNYKINDNVMRYIVLRDE